MKKLFLILLGCVASVMAGPIETVTVTITNAPTTDGMTFVLGSSTRTWKAVVSLPGSQIQTGATIGAAATNFYAHVTASPFAGVVNAIAWSSTNIITFSGLQGITFTASQSGNWASIVITTNTLTDTLFVKVPAEASALTNRQYIWSQAVSAIDKYATNAFTGTNAALADYVNVDQVQTVTGDKTFTGNVDLSGLDNTLSGNVTFVSGSTTVFDTGSFVGFRDNVIFVGDDGSTFWNFNGTNKNLGTVPRAVDVTNMLTALKANKNSWSGTNSFAQITNSFVTGSTVSNSTLSGYIGALTNGTITGTVVTNGTFYGTIGALTNGIVVNAGATNLTLTNSSSTYNFDFAGDVAFKVYSISSLANSNNANVNLGTNVSVRIIPGPTAAYGLNGVAGGRNGKFYIVKNATAQTVTIYNESGVDPTPANRIYTQTLANQSVAPNGSFLLIYDSVESRWNLVSVWQKPTVVTLAFNTIAALRAYQDYPISITGTTVVAFVLGGAAPGDGNGGNYYFDTAIGDNDNAISIIIPNGKDPLDTGRWIKYL